MKLFNYEMSVIACGNGRYTIAYEMDDPDLYVQIGRWLIVVSRLDDEHQSTEEADQGDRRVS